MRSNGFLMSFAAYLIGALETQALLALDVLAGAIVGLMAQGLRPFDAAVCGAALHARAGELWRDAHGDSGLLASDLLPLLPVARMEILRAP